VKHQQPSDLLTFIGVPVGLSYTLNGHFMAAVSITVATKVEITNSSAIAERPRCRVGQFWPKVENDILQTI